MVMATALLFLATLACQPPAGSAGAAGPDSPSGAATAGGSVSTLERGLSDNSAAASADDGSPSDSGTAASADSDFGEVDPIDDPFGLIAPAFQGIGFQNHSTTCDPFDEAYGTCL
ncbi:MAG: hypothetical protein ACE5GX_09695 [Thermoanaerobaculia bacterium]